MRAVWRYALLLIIAICALFILTFAPNVREKRRQSSAAETVESSKNPISKNGNVQDFNQKQESDSFIFTAARTLDSSYGDSKIFDFQRCRKNGFTIHVYPENLGSLGIRTGISEGYAKIITALKMSRYYTENASEACLFVLSFDTLDRDKLSQNYFHNFQTALTYISNNLWNHGKNHLIFNHFFGTWPDYRENALNFDYGFAILARSSFSELYYRRGFDVSFPLFHANSVPLRTIYRLNETYEGELLDGHRNFFLFFKGKRYVHGIGSESRNSLHHIHDGRRIVILTSCRHGNDWQRLQDTRCEQDNFAYDRFPWSYEEAMRNATFCAVPRGRRLGSFRLVEALRAGCVPVVLADGWLLPFHEVIDWDRVAVRVPEQRMFTMTNRLRSIPEKQVRAMRANALQVYAKYFSSVQTILLTTLAIVEQRLFPKKARPTSLWLNADSPSALFYDMSYARRDAMTSSDAVVTSSDAVVTSYFPFHPVYKPPGGAKTVTVLAFASRIPVGNQELGALSRFLKLPEIAKAFLLAPTANNQASLLKDVHVILINQTYPNVYSLHHLVKTHLCLMLDISSPNLDRFSLKSSLDQWTSAPGSMVGCEQVHTPPLSPVVRQEHQAPERFIFVRDSALLVPHYYLYHLMTHGTADVTALLERQPECAWVLLNLHVWAITLGGTPGTPVHRCPTSRDATRRDMTATELACFQTAFAAYYTVGHVRS